MTQNPTEKLSVEIIEFVIGKTDSGMLALNALAGAVTVLAVRGGVNAKELFAHMREDYRAMLRLKNGGVIVTDTNEPDDKGDE
tara:strand:- start:176 stop:424 length:249 start_codon:yes stop_codon:yes gene_type:complete